MSVYSIYGLSLVIILVNFTLARLAFQALDGRWGLERTGYFPVSRSRRAVAVTSVVLLIWIGTSLLIFHNEPDDPPVMKVAAVQHNHPLPGHQDTPSGQIERLRVLSELSRQAAGQGASLIVMPELGLGFDPQVDHTEEFRALASETGAYLWIGYGVDDPRGWRNEMVLLTPEGEFLEVYGKNHPTSPGEPRIITSGHYPVYKVRSNRVSTLICNDVHYTDVSRKLARREAQLIAVPTLEGPGIALEQVAQSVMRAVENRVAMVKVDVAYASAIIDPYGRIVALENGAPEGKAFAMVSEVPLGTARTLYNRVGDLPGWCCLAGLLLFTIFQRRISKIPAKEDG